MKTRLTLAFLMIAIIVETREQTIASKDNDQTREMKTELPQGLPFQPDDPGVEIVGERWDGNVQTIRYKWQSRSFEEKRVWFNTTPREPESARQMRKTLADAVAREGLNLTDEGSTRLLMALQGARFEGVPERVRSRPDLVAMMALQLKGRVASCLGTTDPRIIKRILELDLGYQYPPMEDYQVRRNLMEETQALEKSITEKTARKN